MRPASVKPLSIQVRATLFASLAGLELAALPADKAFALLRLPGAGQARLDQAYKLISQGVDVATAGETSALFTPLESSVLRAALHAGSPAATYRRLADAYIEQAQQIAAIKSRLALPFLVLCVAWLLNPLPSLIAGAISGVGYAWQVLSPLIALLGLYFLSVRFKQWLARAPVSSVQNLLDHFLLRVPLFGAMQVRRNHRDFYASLALMLDAGIPLFDALPKALDAISNSVLREDYSRVLKSVMRGDTLAQAVSTLRYGGNAQVVGYIHTGEASGTLPEMLSRFVRSETDVVTRFHQQAATWIPRMVYGLVMCWMAYGLLAGSAFMPPRLR